MCFDALNTAERVEEKEEENEEEEEKEKVSKINCVRNGIGIRNCPVRKMCSELVPTIIVGPCDIRQ